MKVKKEFALISKTKNRSRPLITHIIPSDAKVGDACLCGVVILGVNGWEMKEEKTDSNISKRCIKSYEKRIRLNRWKR